MVFVAFCPDIDGTAAFRVLPAAAAADLAPVDSSGFGACDALVVVFGRVLNVCWAPRIAADDGLFTPSTLLAVGGIADRLSLIDP